MTKKGHDNLIPFTELTEEEHRKIAVKGGKASGKARAEKKKLKEIAKLMLEMEIGEGRKADIESTKHVNTLSNKRMTVAEAMMMVQIQKAVKGDPRAFELVRDMIGENPNSKQDAGKDELSKLDELLSQMSEIADE